MRLDLNGNTEVLQAFWNLLDEKYTDVVPPLLAYADLMATLDGRNLETARLIYEQFLEPTHAAILEKERWSTTRGTMRPSFSDPPLKTGCPRECSQGFSHNLGFAGCERRAHGE